MQNIFNTGRHPPPPLALRQYYCLNLPNTVLTLVSWLTPRYLIFTACDCHENGTYTLVSTDSPLPCDERGKCVCRPNVIGLKCDQCRENYWNINSGDGCVACECHSFGAYNDSCDINTGQCICKPGVGGRQCDECLPDHYQFSPDGCKGKGTMQIIIN